MPTPPISSPPDPPPARRGGPLRAVIPAAEALTRRARGLAAVSAASAVVLWALLFAEGFGAGGGRAAASAASLVLLLLPAAGTALAASGFRSLLALPQQVRALPDEVLGGARDTARGLRAPAGRPRLLGFLGAMWRVRRVAGSSRGTFLRVGGLARLLSLPLLLLLSAAFVLSFVVIGAAGVAVVAWLLGVLG